VIGAVFRCLEMRNVPRASRRGCSCVRNGISFTGRSGRCHLQMWTFAHPRWRDESGTVLTELLGRGILLSGMLKAPYIAQKRAPDYPYTRPALPIKELWRPPSHRVSRIEATPPAIELHGRCG